MRVTPSLAAAVLAFVPLGAAAAAPTPSYAGNPYALAATCAAAQPIAFVNLALRNAGKKPSKPVGASATDEQGALSGTAAVPSIGPGASIALQIPLMYVALSGSPVAGSHLVSVTVGTKTLEPLVVSVPADFCTPGSAPVKVPAGAKVPQSKTEPAAQMQVLPSSSLAKKTNQRAAAIVVALNAPVNVHVVLGGADCAAHVGPIGALVCPDMIRSRDVLLGWDWQAGAGPQIDGYRVYRVDGGMHALIVTQANKSDVTLADLPKSTGGPGRCYAVAAFAGARESALSSTVCAGPESQAKIAMLPAVHRRSSKQSGGDTGNAFTGTFSEDIADYPTQVGFAYTATKHTLGDSSSYGFVRAGVAFDVGALRNHRLVSARLHLTIRNSDGAGNNHSCATGVGTGTEFWWQNASWLRGSFPNLAPGLQDADRGEGIAPTDTGPEIVADVTSIVAPWLRGEPNYGFVIKNADENPNAFTNKRCLTTYIKPLLEVTYY